MNILVTAGNTQVFIDRVRCITNTATGRTGAAIALEAYRRGHRVTLLTSRPDNASDLKGELPTDPWRQHGYQTMEELRQLMARHILEGNYDGVIHSAAVSDYIATGVFAAAPGTTFSAGPNTWQADAGKIPALVSCAADKIKSDAPEIWLRLVSAPKLVDMIRADWGFRGILVKFKLEVELDDDQLLERAENSRTHSQANLMIANTLDEAPSWAYLGPLAGGYAKIARRDLAARLLEAVENLR